jgi:hypothetical protein
LFLTFAIDIQKKSKARLFHDCIESHLPNGRKTGFKGAFTDHLAEFTGSPDLVYGYVHYREGISEPLSGRSRRNPYHPGAG